jgi:hypothetical protein
MIRALLIAFLLLHSVAVFYQAPASSSTLVLASNCVPTTPSKDQNSVTPRQSGEPLADKLARSDGTLCPPSGVDAQIRTAAPDTGASKMPVIPPPGSAGGDPSVRPK